jgi:hypothetical protein
VASLNSGSIAFSGIEVSSEVESLVAGLKIILPLDPIVSASRLSRSKSFESANFGLSLPDSEAIESEDEESLILPSVREVFVDIISSRITACLVVIPERNVVRVA